MKQEQPQHGTLLQRIAECFRFLCVGLWATILDVIVLFTLTSLTELSNNFCFVISFYTSVLCRFFADRLFTFAIRQKIGLWEFSGQLLRYVASCTVTMLIGVTLFHGAQWTGCSVLISKLISIPAVTASGYLLFRFFVFRVKRG